MPTIKDIAQKAGVSQGTVSNVFNGRGNVSVEKINLVKQAAMELGYRADMKAKMLRQGITKTIAVILPDIKISDYAEIYSQIQAILGPEGYSINLYMTNDMPALEINAVKTLAELKIDGVIAVTCLDCPEQYYTRECIGDAKMIYTLRRPQGKGCYVGFDYQIAGDQMASYALRRGMRKIGIFTGPAKLSCERDFYEGIRKRLEATDCVFCHVETGYAQMKNRAFDFFDASDEYDCFMTTSAVLRDAVYQAVYYHSGQPEIPVYTINGSHAYSGIGLNQYCLNYRKVGNAAARLLLEPGSEELEILIEPDGFTEHFTARPVSVKDSINVLLVTSPTSQALNRIAPAFTRETGIKLNITVSSYDEVYGALADYGNTGLYDVVRLDMAWLPWFSERNLRPLSEIAGFREDLYDQILPQLYGDYCCMNGKPYAMPLDPSVQLLFYRKDLFEDVKIKRGYYEKYRAELRVPESYAELSQIAEYFTRHENTEAATEYGMTMVAGNSGFASCEMIPRFLCTGEPLTDSAGMLNLCHPKMIEALDLYLKCAKYSRSPDTQRWDSAAEEFASGKAAMTIVFANYASRILSIQSAKTAGKVGVAPVPGGKPLLGGGVLAVARGSEKAELALEFLRWISSGETARVITSLGGVSANARVYEEPEILDWYPWMVQMKESFGIGVGRKNLIRKDTFIDERKAEHILGMAIKNALAGGMSSREALEFATRAMNDLIS